MSAVLISTASEEPDEPHRDYHVSKSTPRERIMTKRRENKIYIYIYLLQRQLNLYTHTHTHTHTHMFLYRERFLYKRFYTDLCLQCVYILILIFLMYIKSKKINNICIGFINIFLFIF